VPAPSDKGKSARDLEWAMKLFHQLGLQKANLRFSVASIVFSSSEPGHDEAGIA
jgi:hypothetical protein